MMFRAVPLLLLLLALAPAVPARGAPPPEAAGTDGRLLLGSATAEQLASLDGVDAPTAARIVALREARGGLGSVEELRALDLPAPVLAALRERTAVQVRIRERVPRTWSGPEEVLSAFDHEPPIEQVHDWANTYANTRPEQVRRWLQQSVTFATLPQLTFEVQARDDWDQGFEYLGAEGAELLPDAPAFPVRTDADQSQYQQVRARLVWDLDKLIMSSERIRVINEAQDVVELRDRVLTEVTRLYYERRRVQVEQLLEPEPELLNQVRVELRKRELTANLDALTGGRFSAALVR